MLRNCKNGVKTFGVRTLKYQGQAEVWQISALDQNAKKPPVWAAFLEATTGFEPVNGGFADLCLTTWLRRHTRYLPVNILPQPPHWSKSLIDQGTCLNFRKFGQTKGAGGFYPFPPVCPKIWDSPIDHLPDPMLGIG